MDAAPAKGPSSGDGRLLVSAARDDGVADMLGFASVRGMDARNSYPGSPRKEGDRPKPIDNRKIVALTSSSGLMT